MDEMKDTPGAPQPAVQDLSKFVPESHRRPGELAAAALFFLVGALGYYFALGMTSGEYSSPSVFPKLASALIMIGSAVNFFHAVKKVRPEDGMSVPGYLFPKDVVMVVLLLVIYCLILPKLHFIASSYLFMVTGMVYLERGKNIIRSLVVSALALALLVAIFRYLFLVILP